MTTERDNPELYFLKEKVSEHTIYDAAMDVYRVWHAVSGKDRDIIDFDLREGPDPSESLTTMMITGNPTSQERSRHVAVLSRLVEQLRKQNTINKKDNHNWIFATAQIEASYIYAKKLAGHKIPNLEYIETTQSNEPMMTPEDFLWAWQEKPLSHLKSIGIKQPNFQAIEKWRKENAITPEKAQESLNNNAIDAISAVQKFLKEKVDVDFYIEPVDTNDYYWVWADTDEEKRFLLRQNFSTARNKIWTPGKTEELGWHEGGAHLARMAKRRNLIRNGKLHPFFGLTTVHGPEASVDEGLGQTLTYFIPGAYDSLSDEGKFQVDSSILRQMVYGNVHIMINDPRENWSVNSISRYIKQFIPWESNTEITREIKDRTQNPLMQAYRYAYGLGARMMIVYAHNLSQRGKRAFLKDIYSKPFSMSQVSTLFSKLAQNNRNIEIDKGLEEKQETFSEELLTELTHTLTYLV